VGRLEVVARRVGATTRLATLACSGPLQAMRAHHLDPGVPEMAFVTISSPGGGVLQGDRLFLDVTADEGAGVHLATASATRIYRCPESPAESDVRLRVRAGACVEFLPEPYLPYAGASFIQRVDCEVEDGGVLILGEVVGPGRAARGESLAYDLFRSELTLRRPDGELLLRDIVALDSAGPLPLPALLGGHQALGTLLVAAPGFTWEGTLEGIEGQLGSDAYLGYSTLPFEAGAWFRVLAPDTGTAAAAVSQAWHQARLRLLGAAPPPARRF
jgi:urease accessory protein